MDMIIEWESESLESLYWGGFDGIEVVFLFVEIVIDIFFFREYLWLGMVNVMIREIVLVENVCFFEELIVLCIIKDEIIIDWKYSKYLINLFVLILI